jgi:hypothetical protein
MSYEYEEEDVYMGPHGRDCVAHACKEEDTCMSYEYEEEDVYRDCVAPTGLHGCGVSCVANVLQMCC